MRTRKKCRCKVIVALVSFLETVVNTAHEAQGVVSGGGGPILSRARRMTSPSFNQLVSSPHCHDEAHSESTPTMGLPLFDFSRPRAFGADASLFIFIRILSK